MLHTMLEQLAGAEVDDLPLLVRFLVTGAAKGNMTAVGAGRGKSQGVDGAAAGRKGGCSCAA